MKGFIEVTIYGGNTKTLIQSRLIIDVEEPGDSAYTHKFVKINYDNKVISVLESYEKIKQLIKEATEL